MREEGRMTFLGIKERLPMEDPIEDGSEVLWITHLGKTIGRIRRMVLPKKQTATIRGTEAVLLMQEALTRCFSGGALRRR